PRLNLFVGANGEGKTNLLEAIYFLATTRSFRTNQLPSLVRLGRTGVHVRGECADDEIERELSIGLEIAPARRRELLINGQRATLHEYVRHLPLVAYSSSRLEILRGGPEERRRFLDRGIAMLHPGYLELLGRYQRALRQRNALLARISTGESRPGALEPWNAEFLELAAAIVTARTAYTSDLLDEFHRTVRAHDYRLGDMSIRYDPSGLGPGGEGGEEALRKLAKREIAAGFTLIGPQRDEVTFLMGGEQPAGEVLSGGEVKMLILFLKFSKIALFVQRFEQTPVFLLDDVDAELDLKIIERLLRFLFERVQVFTTSAKRSVLEGIELPPHRVFTLEKGASKWVGEAGS
ncbi:MAG TPA: DNA replication and repair protein RecF, partial [Thermoanaerobaculia bacterium]|nr:DNA replication and repair protein RecF [Thermoanaerobaculia bacterium]